MPRATHCHGTLAKLGPQNLTCLNRGFIPSGGNHLIHNAHALVWLEHEAKGEVFVAQRKYAIRVRNEILTVLLRTVNAHPDAWPPFGNHCSPSANQLFVSLSCTW
jgi:hypothetical protein